MLEIVRTSGHMRAKLWFLAGALIFGGFFSHSKGLAESHSTPHAEVFLELSHESLSAQDLKNPSEALFIVAKFKLESAWHVYWRNPGDSGLPPKFKISSTTPLEVGATWMPKPKRIFLPNLVNYGYEGEVFFAVPFSLAASHHGAKDLEILIKASWLICREECVPAKLEKKLSLSFGTDQKTTQSDLGFEFRKLRDRGVYPVSFFDSLYQIERKNVVLQGRSTEFKTVEIDGDAFKVLDFFPQDSNMLEEFVKTAGESSRPLGRPRLKNTEDAQGLTGLFEVFNTESNSKVLIEGKVVSGSKVVLNQNSAKDTIPNLNTFTLLNIPLNEDSSAFSVGIVYLLFLAFLGGILLNLMPCVLPVLSIKLTSFSNHGQRALALWYAAGVLVSFWILAGIVIVVKSSGHELGWGFQLRSLPFVFFLALMFFAFSLNLLGFFEFGESLARVLNFSKQKSQAYESFLTGMLTTLAATPCSGPFMATAVGAGLSGTVYDVFGVLTFLGLGVASPVLVFSLFSDLIKWRPKPGLWMVRLKEFLAFPLLITVAWLVGVGSALGGTSAVYGFLGGIILLFFALWAFQLTSSKVGKGIVIVGLVFGLSGLGLKLQRAQSVRKSESSLREINYMQQVDGYRSQGKSVFLDFTAEWCVTCKVNERAVLETKTGQKLFQQYGVEFIKIDYTNEDASIAKLMKHFGRNSVPLYVYFPKDPKGAEVILPQLLTISTLEEVFRNN